MSTKKSGQEQDETEIRIRTVPKDIREDLTNIAKNKGISLSTMLKPELRKIRDSYPNEMRKPPRAD
jgi:hypothetical protein